MQFRKTQLKARKVAGCPQGRIENAVRHIDEALEAAHDMSVACATGMQTLPYPRHIDGWSWICPNAPLPRRSTRRCRRAYAAAIPVLSRPLGAVSQGQHGQRAGSE